MNPYKVLGVHPNASKEEVENAYRDLIENPKFDDGDNPMEFVTTERLNEVNDAFYSLINTFKYKEIRNLIENEEFISAETELNLISDKKNPEWNYLKGFVMLKKGWMQAGITHLKTAYELEPSNLEYKETLQILNRKVAQIKHHYAKVAAARNSSQGGDMCGGGSGGGMDMCGGGSQPNPGMGGNPFDNLANMAGQGGNPLGGNQNMGGNPFAGMGGGNQGNPLQNMLLQNMMSPNNMNMCGGGNGGGMC